MSLSKFFSRLSIPLLIMGVVAIIFYSYSKFSNLGTTNISVTNEAVSTIPMVVKGFIEFDSSLNTADSIDRIDEAKNFVTDECFEMKYLNNGRFMNLPDVADPVRLDFIDHVTEVKDNGSKVMVMWSETIEDRVYTYTGIFNLDSENKIKDYREIPHLK